jgi:hypothetical protein
VRWWVLPLALTIGCGQEGEPVPPDHSEPDPSMMMMPTGDPVGDETEIVDPVETTPAVGFIGSPCTRSEDCTYDGGVCLTALPGGMCTQRCDRFCPDHEGYPITFCIAGPELDATLDPGGCVSRCDFGAFPERGCREGYGCVPRARVNDDVVQSTCIAGAEPDPDDCKERLAALGVDFDPSNRADAHPSGRPELTCHVEDPVVLHPPIHGVDFAYYDGTPTPNVTAACNMALALVDTVDDVAARGVTKILHYGTYNCRVISGTSRLSRHAYGDAIDLYGFEFSDGRRYTVQGDFEDGDETPETMPGIFLYEAVHRWHDEMLWSIILTPNYNDDHDDHFHVDLTPGSDFLGLWGGPGYLGPAPYDD